jgi:O-antigen/teichoic acid export membrane protein
LVTIVAEFLVVISMIATFRVALMFWGELGFGEWVLSRRILSFLGPLISCGLEFALIQSLAGRLDSDRSAPVGNVFAGSLAIVLCTSLVLGTVLVLFPDSTASILYGNRAHSNLSLPLAILMLAYGVYVPGYAYFRGTLMFITAAYVHIIMFAVIPLISVIAFPASPRHALLAMGLMSLALSMCVALLVGWREYNGTLAGWREVRELARTGLPRMLSALGLIGLGALPGVIVANLEGVAVAGQVVFGITLVGVVATALTPVSVYLFPTLAHAHAKGELTVHASVLRRVTRWLWLLCITLLLAAWVLAPVVVELFFGQRVDTAVMALRLAALAAGPFAYFVLMRNWIEAGLHGGAITCHVLSAVAVFLMLAAVASWTGGDAALGVMLAYVTGVMVLSALTWNSARLVTGGAH